MSPLKLFGMISSARADRLRKLIEQDLCVFPDLEPSSDTDPNTASDDDSGGVLLEPTTSRLPASEQTASKEADSSTKAPPAENIDRRFVWVNDAESHLNQSLNSMRPTTAPPPGTIKLPAVDFQRGDLAFAHNHYTPIQALAKYPYKYCNKSHMQDIAAAFFDQGKFWDREWDLYYVWDFEATKPLVLVCENQVQALLAEINKHLSLDLSITDQQREEGLLARFPDHPRCLPRYLGRSYSREDVDNMARNAPGEKHRAVGEASHPPLRNGTVEEFKQLMETVVEAQKAKSKANKVKKQQDRLVKNKAMVDQFKRAQRYLGLRTIMQEGELHGLAPAIDASMPVPFTFDQSMVFVCVDVESYERDHNKITEIGVATLDTQDLVGIAPGVDGEAWRELIQARHFRIKEYRHLVNHDFVKGCPDSFRFGESTVIPLGQARNHVADCFRPPFAAQGLGECMEPREPRKVIFLGHDTRTDMDYLQKLKFDPLKENIIELMDTATMYRVWHRDQQSTGLGKILADLGIAGWDLHNAGNDAVFTVQAMLAICVREATLRGARLDELRERERTTRLNAALEEAKEKARYDAEGWSDHEAHGDGGGPVPLAVGGTPNPLPAQSKPRPLHHHHSTTAHRMLLVVWVKAKVEASDVVAVKARQATTLRMTTVAALSSGLAVDVLVVKYMVSVAVAVAVAASQTRIRIPPVIESFPMCRITGELQAERRMCISLVPSHGRKWR
ncbi:qde-2-interacting [Pyrenophora seminiperda CCB06]|uniref:Qde-2-interacting n=1 Tax=Pyrenophora seminiperda CCB06 TaxID=1302712 RepID=A0A3M7LYD6_9PLEO|nr:qde-2-interacting [Pyrenophora seminiperda CCB06]